jgi:hypothetical protein
MKHAIEQAISTIVAIAMLQSLFMFPFWFWWNEVAVRMIPKLNPIEPIGAWLFLFGLNLFKYYMIEPDHVQACLKEGDD